MTAKVLKPLLTSNPISLQKTGSPNTSSAIAQNEAPENTESIFQAFANVPPPVVGPNDQCRTIQSCARLFCAEYGPRGKKDTTVTTMYFGEKKYNVQCRAHGGYDVVIFTPDGFFTVAQYNYPLHSELKTLEDLKQYLVGKVVVLFDMREEDFAENAKVLDAIPLLASLGFTHLILHPHLNEETLVRMSDAATQNKMLVHHESNAADVAQKLLDQGAKVAVVVEYGNISTANSSINSRGEAIDQPLGRQLVQHYGKDKVALISLFGCGNPYIPACY